MNTLHAFQKEMSMDVYDADPVFGDVPAAKGKRAFDKVALNIRSQIQDGSIKAGDRLANERQLAEHFGVSRNTVREAIRSLENAGLLTLRRGPGGGAFVARVDGGVIRNGISDLMTLGLIEPSHLREARVIIGVAVARLAAERRTYADLNDISENIAQTVAAAEAANLERRLQLQFDFHRLLAKATQNPALGVLTDAVIGLNQSLVQAAGMRSPAPGLLFRRRMFSHLENKDADAAMVEMEKHLERLRRFYDARLRKDRRP